MDNLEDLNYKLCSLTIFRGLLDDAAIKGLRALLSGEGKRLAEKIDDYSFFVSRLFAETEDLTKYIWSRIRKDQNSYVLRKARKEMVDPVLEECLLNELGILEEIAQLNAREVKRSIGYEGFLPEWKNGKADYVREYALFIQNVSKLGYGVFSGRRMFTVENSGIVPVEYPDPVTLSDLKGYARERKAVIDNTLALLDGKPAANVLLYGDAGTGKSSTVKAVVNEYCDRGLRLIEIRKNQLPELPSVIGSLHRNPLKFILFIDDLSFEGGNEEIGVLKAILEGTVSARASNAVIYATSNRRHLINEKFSDRANDEIHRNETMQEQISLSDRFGLSVCFSTPGREEYLAIVDALAAQYGLRNTEELALRAERYAIERGGRSPRAARQFVEHMISAEK